MQQVPLSHVLTTIIITVYIVGLSIAWLRGAMCLAVLFCTHLAKVTAWLESLRRHLLEDLNFTTGTPSLEDTQVSRRYRNRNVLCDLHPRETLNA